MPAVAARTPKRRGGRRLLIVLVLILLIAAGAIFWLNSAAAASVNASATLTVFQPVVTLTHANTDTTAATGATVAPGDSVATDIKGRAAIQLPDGTLTRLATGTKISLDSAHFSKSGELHDVRVLQSIGRTFTNVQHLVAGATFQVAGQSAVASVRGTKFEILVKSDGSMLVKLFSGTLDFDSINGKSHQHLIAGQQATADPQGNISAPIPIVPEPGDPFGPSLAASDAAVVGTTPGTEQDFVGPPLHNGEAQTYSYSYAGGSLLKAALGYPGSSMKLTVVSPDGQTYFATGTSPIIVTINNPPSGIYKVTITGISGLGAAGEEPYLSVASVEACASAEVDQNGAVRRAYKPQELAASVQVNGLSNLKLSVEQSDSIAGAIIHGTGTYNAVGWTGTVVLTVHGGALDIIAVSATVFGLNVPAQQIVQQIGSAIGSDPSNVNPGFVVDRLFTCKGVVVIDGRHG